jgi:hypothetical protein
VLPANDIEWDASGKNYRVKIGNEWLDVPPWALVRGPNRMGRMLVSTVSAVAWKLVVRRCS